jgi:hypothetical protein
MMLLIQPFRFSLPRPLQAIRRDLKNTVDHSLNFEVVSVLKFQFCLLTRPVGCVERLNSLRDADTLGPDNLFSCHYDRIQFC